MDTAMWDKIEHDGYEVWILPFPAYGPPAADTPWHYTGYFCRHGSDARIAGQSVRFHELVATFLAEEEARDSGYSHGRRLIDALGGIDVEDG
jgi:hypothetical protein